MIYVGTSGYGYDDWHGPVYPVDLPRNERLAFYAAEFDAVELNFTYYRVPTAEHLEALAEQAGSARVAPAQDELPSALAEAEFQFTLKAHQDITHLRRGGPAPFAQLRAAVAPLQHRAMLGAVLLQFPYSFGRNEENVGYLERCFELLPGLPLVVEFRSQSWLSRRTLNLLREAGVGFCNVDLPELRGLPPRTAIVTSDTAYVRFHGRNKKKWWVHEQAWERYDYSYPADELKEWVPHIQEMATQAERLFAFANNHWEGQSVTTARQLRLYLERQDQALTESGPS